MTLHWPLAFGAMLLGLLGADYARADEPTAASASDDEEDAEDGEEPAAAPPATEAPEREQAAHDETRFQLDDVPVAPKTEAPAAPIPPATKTESRWYGAQVLLVDGVTVLMIVGGASAPDGPFLTLGGLSYVFGPAVVHMAHSKGGAALLSPLLRFGLPIVALGGAALVVSSDANGGGSYDDSWIGAGLMVGVVAAVVIDSAVLSYEQVEVHKDDPKTRRGSRLFTFRPAVVFTREGGGVLVSGAF